jgi:hypothetical protein
METQEDIESQENNDTFQWIDCSLPGNIKTAANRHIVHKHSMKGVGLPRRKLARRQGRERIPLDLSALQTPEALEVVGQIRHTPPSPSWWLGSASGMDPFIKYPVELDPTARELISVGELPSHSATCPTTQTST